MSFNLKGHLLLYDIRILKGQGIYTLYYMRNDEEISLGNKNLREKSIRCKKKLIIQKYV